VPRFPSDLTLADLDAIDRDAGEPKRNGYTNGAAHVDDEKPAALVTAKSIAQHVALLAAELPCAQLATGIKTLDDCFRGGVPSQRFLVIGGAPGAFKTSFAARLAYIWAKAGIFVGIMAVDEGPEGYIDRIAMYEACKRELLDEHDAEEWARLAEAVKELPIELDDGSMTFENFAAHIRKKAGSGPAVVISDSIQTVPIESIGERKNESRREYVDRVVRAHKHAVIEHNLLILALCELSRAFYRSEALAKELNPLAAFKETGSIEYSAQTALVLTTPRGHGELVDVTVAKNRGFRKEPFRLEFHQDLSFHETEKKASDDDTEEVAEVSRPLERCKAQMLAVLRTEHNIRSKAELYRRVRGQKQVKVEALKEHLERGDVCEIDGCFRIGANVAQ
jgi:hypothetical protein